MLLTAFLGVHTFERQWSISIDSQHVMASASGSGFRVGVWVGLTIGTICRSKSVGKVHVKIDARFGLYYNDIFTSNPQTLHCYNRGRFPCIKQLFSGQEAVLNTNVVTTKVPL